ncbi:MAG: ammonia channel protein, partial [Candidatus Methylopumilus sp.]|nr:ammonia channel protein [Candidatus Methylopumilus sp.]
MKRLLSTLALVSALGLGFFGLNNISFADEVAAPEVAAQVEAAPAADAATPAAETAAAAPVTLDVGNTAFMIIATILVILMA